MGRIEELAELLSFLCRPAFHLLVKVGTRSLVFSAAMQNLFNRFCGYLHLPEIGFLQMWEMVIFLSGIAYIFTDRFEFTKREKMMFQEFFGKDSESE